jgi:transposase-like protein
MPSYKGHRYTVEIINHCVWSYFRFPLSFREVEVLMLETRCRGQLRNDPTLVRQIRAGLRQRAAPTPPTAR